MIADLKPYPAYRDSGVPWLGKVPEAWNVLRGRHLFEIKKRIAGELGHPVLSVTQAGLRVKDVHSGEGQVSQDYSKYQIIKPGEFVMNSMDLLTGGVGIAGSAGVTSPDYRVFAIRNGGQCRDRYVLHVFRMLYANRGFYAWGQGSAQLGRWRLPRRRFNEFPFPVPPLPEQAAIVRFLNHADRRIRHYIRAKQKLITLLEEQKQAIIHRAVTRGLDPNVRLKPSGVEWLGEVPEHWEVQRVKVASQILRGKFTHRPRNDPSLYDGPYPFIQTGEVARATKAITTYKQTLNERGLTVSKMFPAGTLVMTIAANIGDVAVLNFNACFPDSVVGFVPSVKADRDFLFYLFRAMKPEFLREAPVNTQGNLNVDRIGSRGIALPPLPEQRAIVNYVEQATSNINQITNDGRSEIELLREYRTRLIADVVTGKLDVRHAAAKLPDETEEAESLDEAEELEEGDEDTENEDVDGVADEAEA